MSTRDALAGIEGFENVSKDIIVHAHDKETTPAHCHETTLKSGPTLNPEKSQFNMLTWTS